MTKTKKKILGLALSASMIASCFTGMSISASAEPTGSTYTVTIPSTLTVENSGWNSIGNISASGTLEDGKKLNITATSANSWALKSGDNSVTYTLNNGSDTKGDAATSWDFTKEQLTAGATQAIGIDVSDYSTKPAGTYTDTVTFTAKVEDIQAEPRIVSWTGNDLSGSGNISKDGITLTTTGDAHRESNFYNRGSNTFTAPSGMKFTKIEMVCGYYSGGWTGATSEVTGSYQPEPDMEPDWWENIYTVTWTGSSPETSFNSAIYGVTQITFYIE